MKVVWGKGFLGANAPMLGSGNDKLIRSVSSKPCEEAARQSIVKMAILIFVGLRYIRLGLFIVNLLLIQ